MVTGLIVLGLCLALVQLTATFWGWHAASWVGSRRGAGYVVGLSLLGVSAGGIIYHHQWGLIGWTVVAAPLAIGLSLLAGSWIAPPPHPDGLFAAIHPAHDGCQRVNIPDGNHFMPAFLLKPHDWHGGAVIIVPGAGDSKSGFKWRLVQAMLAQNLLVLTIDTPGHGDYVHRPLVYPDSLSSISAAVAYLREQEGVKQVSVIGISLGGAMAIRALAENLATLAEQIAALVVIGTPTQLTFNRQIHGQEIWYSFRAPVLSMWREISVKQIRQSMLQGRYHSPHTVAELFDLLAPLEHLPRVAQQIPTLLVYSQRDMIAPLTMGRELHDIAPHTTLLEIAYSSHVTLTLIPSINEQIASWLGKMPLTPAPLPKGEGVAIISPLPVGEGQG